MIKLQTLIISILVGILLALVIDFQGPFPIRVLLMFWMVHLIINIFSKKILIKDISFIYKEELLSLILLIPLFVAIKANPVYALAVFGLSEIILIGKENISKLLKHNPVD